ncbi:MAG: S-layer homology domain-containing protein [Clostridiales bacterium]|jgi:hypothetical protein|nr:S-layer homology domain-containing protein [Eubacteriales bacterium]MDH7566496.1 S-layer homology domain-containing protein [Clostridiales bacterium]
MHRKQHKIWISIGTFLFLSLFGASAFAGMRDTEGHWAAGAIDRWAGEGLVRGYPDGSFKPDAPVSRAELIALINRVFHYVDSTDIEFSDIGGNEWFAGEVAKAAAAGMVKGDGTGLFRPDAPVSRQEAALMLARAFGLTAGNGDKARSFADGDTIAPWGVEAVDAMVEKGYITGRPGNLFSPGEAVTRGEALALLDRMVCGFIGTQGTYSGEFPGSVVVNGGNVVLKSASIRGNLYITQGVGDGSVSLEGVTVDGMTVVRGGGEQGILIDGSSLGGGLQVEKKDGKIRVLAEGESDIPDTEVRSGGILENKCPGEKGFKNLAILGMPAGQELKLDGDFDGVAVEAPGARLQLLEGSISRLEIGEGAPGSQVKVLSGSIGDFNVLGKSKIEVVSGNIASMKVEGKGKDTEILLHKGAVISSLTRNAAVEISGEGTANGAKAGAEEGPAGSGGSPGGGGSGSGGGDPEEDGDGDAVLSVVSASALVQGTWIAAENRNGEWVVDLAGKPENYKLTDIKVIASTAVASASAEYLGMSKEVSFSGGIANIHLPDLLGDLDTGHDGVSVGTIRDSAGDAATFTIWLKSGSGSREAVSVRLKV